MDSIKNIKLVIEYDGSIFRGFQKQPKTNYFTVQGFLEAAIGQITGETIKSVCAGRTDRGVHAIKQVVTFNTRAKTEPAEFKRALNEICKEKLYVREAEEVPMRFHARFTAKSRTYQYYILNRRDKSCIGQNYIYHYKKALDLDRMRDAALHFIGEKDFLGFSSCIKETEVSIRKVYSVDIYSGHEFIERYGFPEIPIRNEWIEDLVVIELKASGFLRSMARMICAMLIRIGTGRSEAAEIDTILGKRDPSLLPAAVPPYALFLSDVEY